MTHINNGVGRAPDLIRMPLGLEADDARQVYAKIEQLAYDISMFPRKKDEAAELLSEMSAIFGPERQATFEQVLDVLGVNRELNITKPELYTASGENPAPIANISRIAETLKLGIDRALRPKR